MSDQHVGEAPPGARPPVVILVIDDHALFRGTVERYLREATDDDIHVINTAATSEALKVAAAVEPDIVLVELDKSLVQALDLISTLRAQFPRVCIIALRWGTSVAEEAQAIAAGADRCLSKHTLDTELIDTITALRSNRLPDA